MRIVLARGFGIAWGPARLKHHRGHRALAPWSTTPQADAIVQRPYGFIGTGRMATALARGLMQAGLATAGELLGSDPVPGAAASFAEATGGAIAADNAAVAAAAQVLFLCVKPQQVAPVLKGLRGKLSKDHLLISICAGVPLSALAEACGPGPRIVRVMPNTPCLVGAGASAYALGPGATREDGELVARLLGAVGLALEVEEKLLDAVTGLSGSGPAFVFIIIEALADGGVRVGLPRPIALALATQTVLGAAKLTLETGQHPAVSKDQVASPGGTTIAGIQALEAGGLRAALMAAVEAATRRSEELGRQP